MKKIVLFGGGTTSSQILKGLKQFPVEITAVVGVADNGRSTGKLREEFDIPAVGDITKVMLSMAAIDEDTTNLMNYKFDETCSIGAHSIKNLILTALLDQKGTFAKSIPIFGKLINTKGTVLPLTEDNVNLIAVTTDGEEIYGEDEITSAMKTIKTIRYDKKFDVNPSVFKAIKEADLIVLSAGSLYTSILPHLMVDEVKDAIKEAKADKIYICNLVTQPGETENLTASDHVKVINSYLGNIDAVIVNNGIISEGLAEKYETREQKLAVRFDKEKLEKLNLEIIADNVYTIENNMIRHDSLKTAYLIFSYLMDGKK